MNEYSLPVLIIFGVLIFAVLKIFSKLKFYPVFTAIITNILTIISSLIQFKQIFEIIIAGLTSIILLCVYVSNSSSGGYKHSTKSGGRDKRFKDNTYVSTDADPIVKHAIFSFVLLLIIGVLYVLFSGNEKYKQFFLGK